MRWANLRLLKLPSIALLMAIVALGSLAAEPSAGPADLKLTYKSDIDGTDQPYRLYLPKGYDGKTAMPLLVALHGSSGNQNSYFDEEHYEFGSYKAEADKHGVVIVCPNGRCPGGNQRRETQFQGIGENDVLTVIEEVRKKYNIDSDRIVCTGISMGGTGTSYMCTRYPDLFAGGIPLSSTYTQLELLENLRHVPMLYIQGDKDLAVYARTGPDPITKRLKALKYDVEYWVLPGVDHYTIEESKERVMAWAAERRRVAHPERVTYRTFLPIQTRAYWTEIGEIAEIGPLAWIDSAVKPNNCIGVTAHNVRQLILRPDAALLKLDQPIQVELDGKAAFNGVCSATQQIRLERADDGWRGKIEERKVRPYTAFRYHKIGTVINAPKVEGNGETTWGSWFTDMLRDVTGADLAIHTRSNHRGPDLKDGQDLYIEDLIDAFNPHNKVLARVQLKGGDLLYIFDQNVDNTTVNPKAKHGYKAGADFLVQVSGCRYVFDRSKPEGQRIIESDLDPEKTYTVVCSPSMLTRDDVMKLGKLRSKLRYEWLDFTTISAAWRYVVKHGGKLDAKLDGRIREKTKE